MKRRPKPTGERRLTRAELRRLLAQGEREIEAGVGHSLDSVLADVDALLAREDRKKTTGRNH